MRTAAHSRLYDAMPDTPILNGVVCVRCGQVYFPPLGIGCEICGAPEDQLAARPLGTAGVVFALADVHLSRGDTPTPFAIAEIVLDDGPLIRAMIHPESAPVRIGDRVRGRWNVRGHDANGTQVAEPAFEHAMPPAGADA